MSKLYLDLNGVLSKKKVLRKSPILKIEKLPEKQASSQITLQDLKTIKEEFLEGMKEIMSQVSVNNTVINQSVPSRHNMSTQTSSSDKLEDQIKIDESVFVTQVSIGNIEKGFSNLADSEIKEDKNLKSAIGKLKELKKG